MFVKNLDYSHKSFWYLPTQIGRQIFEKNYKKTHNLQKGWTGLTKYKNFGEGEGIRMSVYTTITKITKSQFHHNIFFKLLFSYLFRTISEKIHKLSTNPFLDPLAMLFAATTTATLLIGCFGQHPGTSKQGHNCQEHQQHIAELHRLVSYFSNYSTPNNWF